MLRATLLGMGMALGLASASVAFGEARIFSDSGIDGPPYQEIAAGLQSLAERHPGWATVYDYGQSLGGQTLRLIKIANPQASGGTQRPAVLISGTTHGNEYLGIEDRLPAWFLENRESSAGVARFFAAGGVIYLIPIVNPDGYERNVRENNNDVDLNRDFDLLPLREPHFQEPESRALAQFIERDLKESNTKLTLTVDYHCCNGSILFPWSYTEDQLGKDAWDAHLAIARLMLQDIDDSYSYGSTSAVLGYLARGTSKDYYFAKYDALSFTYEGDYGNENTKFPKHTVWWDHVLATVAP